MSKRNETRALREALTVLFALPVTILVLVCGMLFDRGEMLTYNPPSVEEDATLEPYTALPVAIPVTADDVPAADLAPVLALPYYPAEPVQVEQVPTPAAKPARKPRTKAMRSAASVTADPIAEAIRRVKQGEPVRAAAKAAGVAESTLRGRLKRTASR